ncbi:MAG: hypothetical protein OEL77_07275, partial [Nitrosopumilus sp.]|nr:hypothetical protein [Nitrosopumilus sp.]
FSSSRFRFMILIEFSALSFNGTNLTKFPPGKASYAKNFSGFSLVGLTIGSCFGNWALFL